MYLTMKTNIIKLLLVVLFFNFSSCKNGGSSFSDYQFADKTAVINCAGSDSKLLNEALYSFENDIAAFYDRQQNSADRAYNIFTKQATNSKASYDKFVSKHSVDLANALKEAGYINEKGVNYSNDLINCIAENMSTEGFKTTFNALVTTNSMSRNLINPALQSISPKVAKDKYLGMYVALEYFYAELLKIDFSEVDFDRPEEANQNQQLKNQVQQKNNGKVDFNKRPAKQ